ncbi:MAG: succinylglutamate desuccinylase/aspartoacylase family protein [Haliangiales bacterium]
MFAGESVLAGGVHCVERPVSRLPSGAWLSLPIAVVHGRRPGPTVWISGAIHGDELNGVEIVRELIERVEPSELCGTILAVPMVNVFGVVDGSRYLPDRRDLNRSFPGSARGSLASRLAHLLLTEVVSRCEFGIDFHTGSGGRSNIAQVRMDFANEALRPVAEVFGAPLLVHAKDRAGSLRHAAGQRGIPYLLFEGGEANRFDQDTITAGVDGALRVFQFLGMIASAPPRQASIACRGSVWVRARHGGIFRPSVGLGAKLDKGQEIGIVTDALNLDRRIIRTQTAGVVIGLLQTPMVNAGDALVHVGKIVSAQPVGG